MPVDRRPPDLPAMFRVLVAHDVAFVVTGSTAALLHGIELVPGDLDITPALDPPNLARLAAALEAIQARPDPDGQFGDWQVGPDGERRWVQRDARPGEREARLTWRPDASAPASFDELLHTNLGALDVVPEIGGRYDDLVRRANRVEAFGHVVLAASIADQLSTLTVARREKDRPRVEALRERQAAAEP
jgi:hypothetical protein